MDSIRARSGDLCARYGGPTDCLDEAEVCLTMRDDKDSYIRLCLNTVSGEDGGEGNALHRTRARR